MMNVKSPYYKKNKGFTLIELIVVISIISLLFAFSLPKFRVNKSRASVASIEAWLSLKTKELKTKASSKKTFYAINIDTFSNSLWTTTETKINEDNFDTKKENVLKLPKNIRITEVRILRDALTFSDVYKIFFYPGGYSDKAIIHIQDDYTNVSKTIIIEPYLSKLKVINDYYAF